MKSYVVSSVLILSLGFALVSSSPIGIEDKQALEECNATNPVLQNPFINIVLSIVSGEKIIIPQEDKCFVFCVLQKVHFVNENASISNPAGLVKYTMKQNYELSRYSDVVTAILFQTIRLAKGIDDKCQKAFVTYYHYATGTFTLAIADGLEKATGIKDQITNKVYNGEPINKNLPKQVDQFLAFFGAFLSGFAKEAQAISQQQATPAPQQKLIF